MILVVAEGYGTYIGSQILQPSEVVLDRMHSTHQWYTALWLVGPSSSLNH